MRRVCSGADESPETVGVMTEVGMQHCGEPFDDVECSVICPHELLWPPITDPVAFFVQCGVMQTYFDDVGV